MRIEYLADRKNTIPMISKWYFDQWGYLHDNNTQEAIESQLSEYLNRDKMPLMLLAYDNDELVGVAQLKYYEMKDAFPDKEHWLGGVYVKKSSRGIGIATKLTEEIISIATKFEISNLNLQTEDLSGGLYVKLGWKPVQEYQREKLLVLIMEKKLTA
jgi:GNAT superfamily N-acetyltransferase